MNKTNKEVDLDTTKIFECGTDIIRLANEFNETINMLVKRFNNLSTTGEWYGVSANQFTQRINEDKKEYELLGEAIFDLGKNMINSAEMINQTIIKNSLEID